MSIFGVLQIEKTVQTDDKTRLDCTKSYITKDEAAITLVEVEPEAGAGFIDITGSSSRDWYLDYQFATDGDKTVSLRITTDGAPQTFTETLPVISEVDDKLFSNDSDLSSHEPDILKWVEDGRATFKNIHRRSQELILAWLDEKGYTDSDGNRLTKAAITDIEEVRQWSTFMTLRLIFQGISNKVDDVFDVKSKHYKALEVQARNRSILRIDSDGDGTAERGEEVRITSSRIIRV